MKFGSVFSGIEAASCAWIPLGWEAKFFSEIDLFPCEVLKYHYPTVPNFGDITKYKEWKLDEQVDVIIGGSPCQAFSISGLRKGLDDPRGNLSLVYLGLIERVRPTWFVWENVRGVLSSNGGGDFKAFTQGIQEIGYSFAYRVLDAQFFGVPQQRRRVFLVGHIGSDWRPSAAVLFERPSVQGVVKQGRQEKKFAEYPKTGLGIRGKKGSVARTLTTRFRASIGEDNFIIENFNTDSVCVRQLTPIECERLQGFSDNYTNIPWRGKDNAPTGHRIKAIGNSMAVPVIRWIGQRIQTVSEVMSGIGDLFLS